MGLDLEDADKYPEMVLIDGPTVARVGARQECRSGRGCGYLPVVLRAGDGSEYSGYLWADTCTCYEIVPARRRALAGLRAWPRARVRRPVRPLIPVVSLNHPEGDPTLRCYTESVSDGVLFAAAGGRRRRLSRVRDPELAPRPVRLPDHSLRSEHELVRTLTAGVYHLDDIADAAELAGLADQGNGRGRRKRGDTIYRHRVRSALDARRRTRGDARSLGDAYWIIDGTPARPANAVFIILGRISGITLALGAAAKMTRRVGEPVDLIFCDPPWQLDVGSGRDGGDLDRYRRRRDVLIPGYVDVPPATDYYDWTLEWVTPAARLLRPGGHLAVLTGPRQSAAVQLAAQDCGLAFTNSVVVPKINGVAPTRNRYATSHIRLTIMSAGPAGQTFNTIPEMGTDERGRPHPRDVWPPALPYYAQGRLRYPNQIPPPHADHVIRALSNPGDLVADFFTGSGTVPRICLFRDRRCFASDINPQAIRFTMATIADIVQSRLAAPPLFASGPGLFPELAPAGAAWTVR